MTERKGRPKAEMLSGGFLYAFFDHLRTQHAVYEKSVSYLSVCVRMCLHRVGGPLD